MTSIEVLKKNLIAEYHEQFDSTWIKMETAIVSFKALNELIWKDNDNTRFNVPPADVLVMQGKLDELMEAHKELIAATNLKHYPVRLPDFV